MSNAKKVIQQSLTPKEDMFCKLYASDKEYFGNGTQSVILAFNIDLNRPNANHNAREKAHALLTKPDILKRIDEYLELGGLNDEIVDKELLFVITQKAELGPKVAAIREYNALKARIIKKLELSGNDKKPLSVTFKIFDDD